MMRLTKSIVFCLVGLLGSGTASAMTTNVAFHKPITLTGAFGTGSGYFGGGTGGYTLPDPAIITDGIFQEGYWATGYWWDEQNSGTHNFVTVELQESYTISGLSVMADNNDPYLLEYRDELGNWVHAWDIPEQPGPGLTPRSTFLATPIVTDALRLSGIHLDTPGHDYAFSVTEIQANAVPLPPSLLTFASGLLGLLAHRCRRGREEE